MNDRLTIVFMGSSTLACPSLEALAASRHRILDVVTQPDRPRGRRLAVAPCSVKARAEELGFPVRTPERINTDATIAHIASLAPDVVVVVAYGQILKRALLDIPRLGCINLHASLLPAYRGAAPIQWAVASGESRTGVSTMYMNEGMDEGDIILQRETAIGPDDTAADLEPRLARIGAELMIETLDRLVAGTAPRRPQDSTLASYAPKLRKEDGRIDWQRSASAIRNRIRGFFPWPCSYTILPDGRRLRVLAAQEDDSTIDSPPGTVICSGAGPVIATGEGALRLCMVQPEGGRPMNGADFVRGHRYPPGARLS